MDALFERKQEGFVRADQTAAQSIARSSKSSQRAECYGLSTPFRALVSMYARQRYTLAVSLEIALLDELADDFGDAHLEAEIILFDHPRGVVARSLELSEKVSAAAKSLLRSVSSSNLN